MESYGEVKEEEEEESQEQCLHACVCLLYVLSTFFIWSFNSSIFSELTALSRGIISQEQHCDLDLTKNIESHP